MTGCGYFCFPIPACWAERLQKEEGRDGEPQGWRALTGGKALKRVKAKLESQGEIIIDTCHPLSPRPYQGLEDSPKLTVPLSYTYQSCH